MNKRGTRAILEDEDTKVLLRSLIVEFDEKANSKSKVSYVDIFEYIKGKFNRNEISFYPSYTWWKTKGKHLVDEFNLVRRKVVIINETDEVDVFDVFDLVEKHYKNKEQLIKHLMPFNKSMERVVEHNKMLESKLKRIQATVDELELELGSLKNKYKNMEKFSDELFFNICGSEKNLRDVMQKARTDREVVNFSLTETFGNPNIFIKEFVDRRGINTENGSSKQSSNVVQFQPKNHKSEQEDDFDW